MLRFVHCILGAKRATFADVVARASPDAERVLELARSFAARRLTQDDALARRHDELVAPPWAGAASPWAPTPRAVTQSDVARALLAVAPDRVRDALEGVPWGLAADLFESAVTRLRDDARLAPAEGPTLDFDRPYTWAWTEMLQSDAGLDVDARALLASFDTRGVVALAAFSRALHDGLVTVDEASAALHARLGCGAPLPTPAYADEHDLVTAIDRSQATAPVTCIVAPQPSSGRLTLVRAWLRRLRSETRPATLAGFAVGGARFNAGTDTGAASLEHRAGFDQRSEIVVLARDAPDGRVRIGDGLFASGSGRLASFSAEELAHLFGVARANPDRLRVLVTMTETESAALARLVDGAASLPTVRIPPPTERDALAMWLARALWLTSSNGIPFDLSDALAGFVRATDEERRASSEDAVRTAIEAARHRVGVWLPRRLVRQAARGEPPSAARLDAEQRALFDRFVGEPERLVELARIYDARP